MTAKRTYKHLTPELEERACLLFEEGRNIQYISDRLMLSCSSISRMLVRKGLRKPRKRREALGNEEKSKMLSLYADGISGVKIAKLLGRPKSTVQNYISKAGASKPAHSPIRSVSRPKPMAVPDFSGQDMGGKAIAAETRQKGPSLWWAKGGWL